LPVNPQLEKWVPTAIASALLVGASLLLIRSHIRSWRGHRDASDLDQADVLHYRNQFRRRVIASGLLGMIGLMLVIGDLLVPWQRAPKAFAVYWMAVLSLTMYVLVLAVADALATSAHRRAALARLRAQRRQLEREAAELGEKPLTDELSVD
jgi:hypothetical protein